MKGTYASRACGRFGKNRRPVRLYNPSIEGMESRELLSTSVGSHPAAELLSAHVTHKTAHHTHKLVHAMHKSVLALSNPAAVAQTASPPPFSGVPLGVNFDLATRWVGIPQSTNAPALGDITAVSMSGDSVVWVGREQSNSPLGSLLRYDPQTGNWNDIYDFPGGVISVSAAVSNSVGADVYVVYNQGATKHAAGVFISPSGIGMTILPTLPGNNDFPLQIAAGSDNTIWVVDKYTHLFSYSPSTGI
jgi:hypothetical protein